MAQITKTNQTVLLDGYMIQRPSYLEIFVKSPIIKELFHNDKTREFSRGLGYLYQIDRILPESIKHCVRHNNRVLIDSYGYPNLAFLRNHRIDEGITAKLNGIFIPKDIERYEDLFQTYTKKLISSLKSTKRRIKDNISSDTTIIKLIRLSQYYDGLGYRHQSNCSCVFDSNNCPISVCQRCEMADVSTRQLAGLSYRVNTRCE